MASSDDATDMSSITMMSPPPPNIITTTTTTNNNNNHDKNHHHRKNKSSSNSGGSNHNSDKHMNNTNKGSSSSSPTSTNGGSNGSKDNNTTPTASCSGTSSSESSASLSPTSTIIKVIESSVEKQGEISWSLACTVSTLASILDLKCGGSDNGGGGGAHQFSRGSMSIIKPRNSPHRASFGNSSFKPSDDDVKLKGQLEHYKEVVSANLSEQELVTADLEQAMQELKRSLQVKDAEQSKLKSEVRELKEKLARERKYRSRSSTRKDTEHRHSFQSSREKRNGKGDPASDPRKKSSVRRSLSTSSIEGLKVVTETNQNKNLPPISELTFSTTTIDVNKLSSKKQQPDITEAEYVRLLL